mmetsp:Transcript_37565/g.112074  ORF Transcript_37565/g.112074 Transcript_37565/m.112074 type:complete len:239 (-) Transcript_37565:300-1016(-)
MTGTLAAAPTLCQATERTSATLAPPSSGCKSARTQTTSPARREAGTRSCQIRAGATTSCTTRRRWRLWRARRGGWTSPATRTLREPSAGRSSRAAGRSSGSSTRTCRTTSAPPRAPPHTPRSRAPCSARWTSSARVGHPPWSPATATPSLPTARQRAASRATSRAAAASRPSMSAPASLAALAAWIRSTCRRRRRASTGGIRGPARAITRRSRRSSRSLEPLVVSPHTNTPARPRAAS